MPLTLAPDAITFADLTTLTSTTLKWTIINTTTNLLSFNKYLTDTSLGAFTVNLPISPSNGDSIIITDGFGFWGNNNLIVNRNSRLINNLAENLICDVTLGKVELIFQTSSNSWRTSIN